MPETELSAPASPATLVPGYTHKESKTLELRCHDHFFENATITDETGAEIFHLKSEYGKSWSFRRSLYDAAGQHVLDFRHYSVDIKNRWTIEDPAAKELGSIEHVHLITRYHSNVNMTVLGQDGKADFVLEMRQVDFSAITTRVSLHRSTVAEINMIERNKPSAAGLLKTNDTSAWRIRVAPMMDLSAIVVMALCRAEMAHVWNQ